MSFLNINLNLLAYADGPSSAQPNMRLADVKWSMMGLSADKFQQVPISLAPGETLTVASTKRSISYDGSTSFVISQSGDKMKITAGLDQRIARNYGNGGTVWTITFSGEIVKLSYISGSTPDFSSMVPGDNIKIGSGFHVFNQGIFTLLSKGSDYVQFLNQTPHAESSVSGTLSIYSSGPVQVGDILNISDSHFSFPNQGSFTILEANDSYIEVLNPNGFPQTVTGVTSGFDIYPYSYKWMLLACDRRIQVGLNGDTPGSLEVEPPVENDLVKSPGLFMKRGNVFQIDIKNPGLNQVNGFVFLAE